MVQHPDANLPHFGPESWTVQCKQSQPSAIKTHITDSSESRGWTFHAETQYHGRSISQKRTFHAKGRYRGRFDDQSWTFHANAPFRGWFRDLTTFFIRITATTDRQAGLTQSPAQPCRIVAAGDALEATEKLYERHYLVIKIVSSFFCLSDKVFVSLSIDLQ